MVARENDDANALRLPLDVRAERQGAGLRVVAAVLAVVGGLWLLALPYPVPRALGVLGLLFSVIFVRRALRARALDAAQHYLELGRDALELREGVRLQVVPWTEVQSVRVDEDRLVVSIERRNATPLEIEPRYRGLGVHALGSAVHEAFATARRRTGCAPATDG